MKHGVNKFVTALAVGALAFAPVATAGLVNAGFEDGNAQPNQDVFGAPGWGGFNSHFTTEQAARTGTQSLKIFGPFSPFGGAGAVQGISASPGQLIEASAWGFDAGAADPDGFQGTNFGVVQLRFADAANNTLGVIDSAPINASAPDQVWVFMSASGVAPAGTTTAEIILLHVQLNVPVTGGSVFYDDASLGVVVVPEPAAGLGLAGLSLLSLRRRR
jgi:hypothetical protein